MKVYIGLLGCFVVLFWLYASVSGEHTSSIFRAEEETMPYSQNSIWRKTQKTIFFIHIALKTSDPTGIKMSQTVFKRLRLAAMHS
jgi:hypothetical protein